MGNNNLPNDGTNDHSMLTTAEAAALLRRTAQTMRRWACYDSGPIQPIRLPHGGPLLWRLSDVERLLGGRGKQAGT